MMFSCWNLPPPQTWGFLSGSSRGWIATSLKRHCVETVSWQSFSVMVKRNTRVGLGILGRHQPLDTPADFFDILEPLDLRNPAS